MHAFEAIYGDALAGFAQVFDRDALRDAIELGDDDEQRTMESETRDMWFMLVEDQMDRFPAIEAADIRAAIREAASELRIPDEWTDT